MQKCTHNQALVAPWIPPWRTCERVSSWSHRRSWRKCHPHCQWYTWTRFSSHPSRCAAQWTPSVTNSRPSLLSRKNNHPQIGTTAKTWCLISDWFQTWVKNLWEYPMMSSWINLAIFSKNGTWKLTCLIWWYKKKWRLTVLWNNNRKLKEVVFLFTRINITCEKIRVSTKTWKYFERKYKRMSPFTEERGRYWLTAECLVKRDNMRYFQDDRYTNSVYAYTHIHCGITNRS